MEVDFARQNDVLIPMRARAGRWVRGGALAGAQQLVAELGGDFDALAAEAGLPPGFLGAPDAPIEAAAVPLFLDLASTRLRCPSFALRLGQYQDLGLFGSLGLPMRNARTVGDLLRALAALFPFHTQGAIVGLVDEGNDLLVTYELSADIYPSHRHVVELGFSILATEIRRHSPSWQSSSVAFRHASPPDSGWHRRLLGSRLLFDADRNAMLLDAELLALPRVTGGDALPIPPPERGHPARTDFIRLHTERVIRASLLSRLLTVHETAGLLGTSTRSLQRQLAAEGTSFEDIVDAVRADLALAYLMDSRLSVAQIAEALQFSETSALSRAVRRWHHRSPRALRQNRRHS